MAQTHTRIFLIRHGATVLTDEDRFAGETNVQLSDVGRQQVGRLSSRLAAEKISAVYASDLDRTWKRRASWPSRISLKCNREKDSAKFPTAIGNN